MWGHQYWVLIVDVFDEYFSSLNPFSIFLNASQKMTYNMKIKNNFFLWLFGEFSDIKSSNRNSMDDF